MKVLYGGILWPVKSFSYIHNTIIQLLYGAILWLLNDDITWYLYSDIISFLVIILLHQYADQKHSWSSVYINSCIYVMFTAH